MARFRLAGGGRPGPALCLLIRPAAVSHRPRWQIYRRGRLISASESPGLVPPVRRISAYFPSTCAFAAHTPPKINQPSNQAPLIRQISPTTTTLSRYTYVSRSRLSPACVTYCLPTCRDVTVTPAINGTLCSSNSNLFDV